MSTAAFPYISCLGREDFRGQGRTFGIKQSDRLFHLYAIGKTGMGKSTFLETMIRQDIAAGRGLCLIDPHGDLVERVSAAIPPARSADLQYLNVPDPGQPFGYNPLHRVGASFIPLV